MQLKTLLPSPRSIPVIAACLLLAGCQDEAQLRALHDQIRSLESLQGQSKAELNRLQMQMRSLQTERDKIKEERDKLQSQIDEAQKALDSIRSDFESYKQQYRLSIRERAPGMELENLEVDGKIFESIKIRSLTDSSLTFLHQAGTMSVSLSQLKPEMQEKLGFQAAMPVMAIKPGAKGMDPDKEARLVEERLAEIKTEIGNLQRKLHDANLAAQKENRLSNGNPTPYLEAAAAIRVKLNQLDVEHQTLNRRNQELLQLIRTTRLR